MHQNRPMTERQIEAALIRAVKASGGMAGVPDQHVLRSLELYDQAISGDIPIYRCV